MATYTVKSGDSISAIAASVLGDMERWPEIATLNNLTNPYTIYPGDVLQLPETLYFDEEYSGSVQKTTTPAKTTPARASSTTAIPAATAFSWSALLSNRWLWIAGGVLAIGAYYYFSGSPIAESGGASSSRKFKRRRRVKRPA